MNKNESLPKVFFMDSSIKLCRNPLFSFEYETRGRTNRFRHSFHTVPGRGPVTREHSSSYYTDRRTQKNE
jgi:hypothetical protein